MKFPRFPSIRLSRSSPVPHPTSSETISLPSHITESEDRPWTLVGGAEEHLRAELEKLYWTGIEHELESVLVTLRAWHSPEFAEVSLPDESDDFVHGFDTFVDQVNDDSRAFADRFGLLKVRVNAGVKQSYVQALHHSVQDAMAEQKSAQLKAAIRQTMDGQTSEESLVRRRARMLLQAIGMLDIEKVIEHRPPLNQSSFGKRPAVPQLALLKYSKNGMPVLTSQRCASCTDIIRGSMYCRETSAEIQKQTSVAYICEDCYRAHFFGNPELVKSYKHCILNEIITPRGSLQICNCRDVPHSDPRGGYLSLWPVGEEDKHRKATKPGMVPCGLLTLGDVVAEAKYDGMQAVMDGTPQRVKHRRTLADEKRDDQRRLLKTTKLKKAPGPKLLARQSQHAARDALKGTAAGFAEDEDEDIPSFWKKHAEKYPFGDVHMALRIGPLVVENGVEHTQGGALVTLRDPPVLHSPRPMETSRALALTDHHPRQLSWQDRSPGKPKRFKAIMKQVVGAPFTGLLDQSLESSIVDAVIAASQEAFDDPGLSRQDRAQWLDRLIRPILDQLKALINIQLSTYLSSVVSRLLDPQTKLRWSLTHNNCQNLSDALLDPLTFGPLVPPLPSAHPLYLISFVTRPTSHSTPTIRSKYDVPRGQTEEYLLRFRYGGHDSDIIDTLHEYWHDWGAFGSPLYPHQPLFPWDCTEAFGRYPTACGACNLSKHVWAFPSDAWSLIALHLTRHPHDYPPTPSHPLPSPASSTTASTTDAPAWALNRLTLLAAQHALASAARAMASTPAFRAHTAWLDPVNMPNPATDRLRLGGIHRAQPFSHAYDMGRYHRYFVADWAHLRREEQVAAYERLRDGRMKLPDVEHARRLYETEGVGRGLAAGAVGAGVLVGAGTAMVASEGLGGGGVVNDAGLGDASGHGAPGGAGAGCAANCGTGCGSATDPGCGSGVCGAADDGGGGADAGGGDAAGGDGGDGGGCGGCGCGGCG